MRKKFDVIVCPHCGYEYLPAEIYLPNYLKSIEGKDIALTDALYELTEKEIEFRDERAAKLQIKVSAFPFEKEIKDFNFDYQPSINKNQILITIILWIIKVKKIKEL